MSSQRELFTLDERQNLKRMTLPLRMLHHFVTTPFRRLFHTRLQCTGDGTTFFLKYDRDADLLLARFGTPDEADSISVEPDVTVRISRATNQPVGIEVVDCAAKFHKAPSAITEAFARELLARYGREAIIRLQRAAARPANLESLLHTR